MAIDFSNKATPGSTDPNAVVSVTPKKAPYWIKTDAEGAWQGIPTNNPAVADQSGYRSVGVATVLLNDGRQYLAILDGNGKPFSEVGDPIESDTTQAQSFNQNKSASKAPNGQQYSRGADGTINEWNPNSNPPGYTIPHPEMSPGGTVYTPEQRATQAAQAQTAEAENKERQWNSDHKYGWVTNADRDKAIREQEAAARADRSQERITAAQEAANQLAKDRLQFDREKANLPTVKVDQIDRNGQRYNQITRTNPDGTFKITYVGPDNKEVDRLPSEGELSVSNKPFPEFIAGHVEEALRTGHEAVYSDPNLTPAQKEKRFQEMVQVANVVTNEANVQFTNAQREAESNRNTQYNIASNKLTYMQTGLGQALDFVGKINGNLPKGSDLGGKAFAAIMGIQMLQLSMSGIDKIPTLTNRDLHSNAALTAHNQTIATQAAAASQNVSAPQSTGGPSPALNQGQALSTPGGQSVSGGTPTSAGARPAATSATALPANRPDQTQVGSQIDNAIMPPQEPSIPQANPEPSDGQPVGGRALPPSSDTGPQFGPPQDYVRVENPTTGEAGYLPRSHWNGRGDAYPGWQEVPGSSVRTAGPGDPVQVPGEAPGVTVPSPDNAGAESRTQQSVSDWPALAGLGSPRGPSSNQQSQQGDMASDAARAAYIKASNPWQLSNEDLTWAKQKGLLDDALAIPGRAAA